MLEININNIFYSISGNGEAILFIHGLGLDNNLWKNIINNLQKRNTCICIDIPGSGKSEFIENGNLETYAKCIKHILNKEKIDKITIIGHSLGGYIALEFANLFPNYLNAIGLFHSTAYIDNADKINNRQNIIKIANEKKSVEFFFKNLIPNQFTEKNKILFKEDINNFLINSFNINYTTLIQYQYAMINRKNNIDILKHIDIPFLFIAGEYDSFVSKKDLYEQSLLCSKSNIFLLNNSAHIGMIEENNLSYDIINNFVNNL